MSEHEHDHDHDLENGGHEHDEDMARDAERLVRKRIALAQIRQYGDPVLRMTGADVESYDDELARVA